MDILLSFSQNHLISNFEFVFYWNTEEENVLNALVTFNVLVTVNGLWCFLVLKKMQKHQSHRIALTEKLKHVNLNERRSVWFVGESFRWALWTGSIKRSNTKNNEFMNHTSILLSCMCQVSFPKFGLWRLWFGPPFHITKEGKITGTKTCRWSISSFLTWCYVLTLFVVFLH